MYFRLLLNITVSDIMNPASSESFAISLPIPWHCVTVALKEGLKSSTMSVGLTSKKCWFNEYREMLLVSREGGFSLGRECFKTANSGIFSCYDDWYPYVTLKLWEVGSPGPPVSNYCHPPVKGCIADLVTLSMISSSMFAHAVPRVFQNSFSSVSFDLLLPHNHFLMPDQTQKRGKDLPCFLSPESVQPSFNSSDFKGTTLVVFHYWRMVAVWGNWKWKILCLNDLNSRCRVLISWSLLTVCNE